MYAAQAADSHHVGRAVQLQLVDLKFAAVEQRLTAVANLQTDYVAERGIPRPLPQFLGIFEIHFELT